MRFTVALTCVVRQNMIETLIQHKHQLNEDSLKNCEVLVVDDDEISAQIITHIISDFANAQYVCSSASVFTKCLELRPDLIILDVNMPIKSGIELCKELKSSIETEDIPVMFATASLDHDTQKACWEAGGDDFIIKPILAMTLMHRVRNILMNEIRLTVLKDISFRDSLTSLYNRHYLYTEVANTLKSAKRDNEYFSIIVLDLDYFKSYNDTYGHLAGDECLRVVANALAIVVHRPYDTAIRFGGEEFVITLPKTDPKGCESVGKRILKTIEALRIPHEHNPTGVVTVSAGYMTVKPIDTTTLDDIINQADLALYEAKEAGRNRLCGFSDTYR